MSALVCPECGEEVSYRSCQQPDTDAIAELALLVHRKVWHGVAEPITPEAVARSFFQTLDARDKERP